VLQCEAWLNHDDLLERLDADVLQVVVGVADEAGDIVRRMLQKDFCHVREGDEK
jgi:hypothetical protein